MTPPPPNSKVRFPKGTIPPCSTTITRIVRRRMSTPPPPSLVFQASHSAFKEDFSRMVGDQLQKIIERMSALEQRQSQHVAEQATTSELHVSSLKSSYRRLEEHFQSLEKTVASGGPRSDTQALAAQVWEGGSVQRRAGVGRSGHRPGMRQRGPGCNTVSAPEFLFTTQHPQACAGGGG